LPSLIIEIVEIMFRTSFWAVPAFSRVEPASTSGPTGTQISRSASAASSEPSTQTRQAVRAPADRAASRAPRTYEDRPLALMPTTASAAVTPSPCTSRVPPSASSSAASRSAADRAAAPATSATT
jgi:hypothetical protein